jgi:uncharacterized protein YbaR (Trm112 family)
MSPNESVPAELLNILLCPACGSALRDKNMALECTACHREYPVKEGIPSLLPDAPKKGI